jgi:NADPH:quinone reductase-like Zn-dependent oxidoreductase
MLITLAVKEGIVPICVVRRQEQVDLLKNEYQAQFVVNSSTADYKELMGAICKAQQPTTCLECIAGETAGEMLGYLGMNSTLILYGALSETNCSGISPLMFLGKNQSMEAFLLPYYLAKLTPQ